MKKRGARHIRQEACPSRSASGGSPEALSALAVALYDEEPLVRGHAARALGRIPDERSVDALRARLATEEDDQGHLRDQIVTRRGLMLMASLESVVVRLKQSFA